MRKIAIFVIGALLILSSCSVPQLAIFSFVDFTKYTKEGFLVTPAESVAQKYESIGIVSYTYRPEYDTMNGYNQSPNDIYNYALSELVKESKKKGANAILNFFVEQDGAAIIVSGYAVKIFE